MRVPVFCSEATRVIVVDDHLDSLVSVGRLLRVLGYDVRTEQDGPTALSCAEEFRPDVALIDLSLPGMDGCAVARHMRALDATRDTRLIAMTGWTTQESQSRTRDAGFDLHLVKPLSVNVLTSALTCVVRASA
ncbi:MAG: response regulator [Gemmatimonadaceae bacterium]